MLSPVCVSVEVQAVLGVKWEKLVWEDLLKGLLGIVELWGYSDHETCVAVVGRLVNYFLLL